MIVPIVHRDNGADYHRLILPLSHMGINVGEEFKSRLKDAKIVIFNRQTGFDIAHLLRIKKKTGLKIVCDLDDYWDLYPNHHLYGYWKATNQSQSIKEALLNSDHIIVTTKKLSEAVNQFNSRVTVIPNALPFGEGQFNDDWTPSDKFRIGFVGGASHQWDLESIKGLFLKMARLPIRHKIEVVLSGYDGRNPDSKKVWDKMEGIVSANGKLNYVRRVSLPLDSYMNHYKNIDLALSPLEDNYFNSFKSPLKIVEAGCKNLPIITSINPPRWFEDMDHVMKADSVNEWFSHIERCIEEVGFAKRFGKQLGEYVRKEYDLIEINKTRKQLFDTLCY